MQKAALTQGTDALKNNDRNEVISPSNIFLLIPTFLQDKICLPLTENLLPPPLLQMI